MTPVEENADVEDLQHSKRHLRDLERIAGKSGVLVNDLSAPAHPSGLLHPAFVDSLRPLVESSRAMALAAIFSKNLQSLRRERRLTQEALAAKAGISVAYVSMLERGQRTPPLETVDLIARALKVPAIAMLEKPTAKRSS